MVSELRRQLTAERLRELLIYAPETGRFYWRASRGSAAAGTEAGNADRDGYRVICIAGVRHFAHRLAWLHVHGEHPSREIDHRNGNRADNRIANLRESSRVQNARNATRRNPSGFKGVRRNRRKWRAEICVNGRRIYLGNYSTAEQAAEAYDKAARLYHGEFARTNAQIAAERIAASRIEATAGVHGSSPDAKRATAGGGMQVTSSRTQCRSDIVRKVLLLNTASPFRGLPQPEAHQAQLFEKNSSGHGHPHRRQVHRLSSRPSVPQRRNAQQLWNARAGTHSCALGGMDPGSPAPGPSVRAVVRDDSFT
jgi:hypothetical protein